MLVTRLDRAPELGTRVDSLVGAAWEFDAGLACRSSMAALLNSVRVSIGAAWKLDAGLAFLSMG